MPYPNRKEMFVLLFGHGNTLGPWAGNLFRELCPYTGIKDADIYRKIKSSDIERDRADVQYYIDNNTWINDPDEPLANGNMEVDVDDARLSRGCNIFKKIFQFAICPAFAGTEFEMELWAWVSKSRADNGLGFLSFGKFQTFKPTFIEGKKIPFLQFMVEQLFGDSVMEAEHVPFEYVQEFVYGVHSRMSDAEKKTITRKRKQLVSLIQSAKVAHKSK